MDIYILFSSLKITLHLVINNANECLQLLLLMQSGKPNFMKEGTNFTRICFFFILFIIILITNHREWTTKRMLTVIITYAIWKVEFYERGANFTPVYLFFVLLTIILATNYQEWTTKYHQTTTNRMIMVIIGF